MLALDSDRWDTLSHAFGQAWDIPDRLRQIGDGSTPEDAWRYLWAVLCHGGSIADAAYAALSGRIRIADGCDRTPESVLDELLADLWPADTPAPRLTGAGQSGAGDGEGPPDGQGKADGLPPATAGDFRIEYRAVWPDGTQRWLDSRGQFYCRERAGAERPVRLRGCLVDITDRKQAELAAR